MNLLSDTGIVTMHGVFISAALVSAVLLSVVYYKRRGEDESLLLQTAPAAIFFGFLGARLMYVTVCDSLYIDPADKLKLTDGGYALFGAIFGAVLTVVVFCVVTKQKNRILNVLDAMCFAAPAAIAIGRMGSVFSEDCLGEAVASEKLRFFPIALYSNFYGEYQYAVFFFEALYCAAIFVFISFVTRNVNKKGVSTYLFTVLYCGGRSFLESIRSDSIYVAFVRISQVLAVLTLIGAFIYMSIKLAKKTGFKKRYIASYTVFTAAFVIAFLSEFFMGSSSKAANTVQVLVCCIVMTADAVYTGYEYLDEANKTAKKRKKGKIPLNGKPSGKRSSDKAVKRHGSR